MKNSLSLIYRIKNFVVRKISGFGIIFCLVSHSIQAQPTDPVIFVTSSGKGLVKVDPANPDLAETLFPISRIQHMAIDFQRSKIYFTIGFNKIVKSNLDGSDQEVMITSERNGLEHIAIDSVRRKLYFSDYDKRMIFRADLDVVPFVLDTVISNGGFPNAIALDLIHNKIYWTDRGLNMIFKSNLDGSQQDTLIEDLKIPEGITLDIQAGKMYWVDQGSNLIERADTSGNNREILVKGVDGCEGIDLNLDSNPKKMYWTDWRTQAIWNATLDSADSVVSNVREVVSADISYPNTLVLDVKNNHMYWTDFELSKIKRADLDGKNLTDIVEIGHSRPEGIALDVQNQKIYWVDRGIKKIQSSNILNQAQINDIIRTGLEYPIGIALDPNAGKIYWADRQQDRIMRAGLDNLQVEPLITQGLDGPKGIALDLKNNKIFWTEEGGKIQKADLDGKNAQTLIGKDFQNREGIALDLKNDKMYWVNRSLKKIEQADLQGNFVIEIVSDLVDPVDIAIDTTNNKIYWTDMGANKVRRAKLDGGNPEDAIPNISNPNRIALFMIPRDSLVIQGDQRTCFQDIEEYSCTYEFAESYHWEVEKGKILGNRDSSIVRIQWDEPGEGNLRIKVRSSFGIVDSLKQKVEIIEIPQPDISGNLSVCVGVQETYRYSDANPDHIFEWLVKGGRIISGQGTPQIEVVWEDAVSSFISVNEKIPELNCIGQITKDMTFVTPNVQIKTENEYPQICGKEAVKLSSESNLEVIDYLWYKDEISEPISDGSFLLVNEPGKYRLDVRTNCGWVSSEELLLGADEVFVPNLFSPNGDGKNDHFTVCADYPEQIKNIELNIFDKYGNQVFNSTQKDELLCKDQMLEKGWDGGNHPPDIYIWTLKVEFKKCGQIVEKGQIKLIR